MDKHNKGGTFQEKKVTPHIYKIQENITNSLFGQKKPNLMENLKANAFFQFI